MNRLDARELAAWWERYDHLKDRFVRGFITRLEAIDGLIQLRYRDDALKAEINVWERARKEEQDRAYFFRKRRELKHAERDVTTSSTE
jgi:hypothetical protein